MVKRGLWGDSERSGKEVMLAVEEVVERNW